jgi:hypothetical protein
MKMYETGQLEGQAIAYLAETKGEVTNPWPSTCCPECLRENDIIHVVYMFSKYMLDVMGGRNCQRCGRALGALAMDYKYGITPATITADGPRTPPRPDQSGTGSAGCTGTPQPRTDG